jgi:hypothetical protein
MSTSTPAMGSLASTIVLIYRAALDQAVAAAAQANTENGNVQPTVQHASRYADATTKTA